MNIAVETSRICKSFGNAPALHDVSLRLESGRLVTLLGPNGAGKTTLFKIVAGLIEASDGSAFVNGVDASDRPTTAPSSLALVTDGCEFPPWMSAEWAMSLYADAYPQFDKPGAQSWLRAHSISLNKPFKNLSQGQRRHVQAALALHSGAPVVLLDEPAAHLDVATRHALHEHARAYAVDRGALVVVSTHLVHDVERVAEEVVLLNEGKALLHAPLDDLRDEVREIRVDTSHEPIVSNGGFVILAGDQVDGERRYWARAKPGVDLNAQLGLDAGVRPVGLEELYLALTKHKEAAVS